MNWPAKKKKKKKKNFLGENEFCCEPCEETDVEGVSFSLSCHPLRE